MSGWARERVRKSRDKSCSESMCAVLSFFPRTEVSRGLIFLAAVRLGWEAETARGSCFLRGTLALSHTAFDPAWLPWRAMPPPNPPPLMYECVSGYVYVRGRTHESRAVIGVVRGTSGGKPWNRRWNLSGKIKWEATLNQGFCSLPLSSFSNKANNFSGMQQGQLDVYSAEILEYGGDKWIVKHACAHAHVEQHYILLHMQFSCVIKEVMLQFICDGHGIKAELDQIICRGRKLYKAYK